MAAADSLAAVTRVATGGRFPPQPVGANLSLQSATRFQRHPLRRIFIYSIRPYRPVEQRACLIYQHLGNRAGTSPVLCG